MQGSYTFVSLKSQLESNKEERRRRGFNVEPAAQKTLLGVKLRVQKLQKAPIPTTLDDLSAGN